MMLYRGLGDKIEKEKISGIYIMYIIIEWL